MCPWFINELTIPRAKTVLPDAVGPCTSQVARTGAPPITTARLNDVKIVGMYRIGASLDDIVGRFLLSPAMIFNKSEVVDGRTVGGATIFRILFGIVLPVRHLGSLCWGLNPEADYSATGRY
jgi:hypothetical protein